MSRSKKSFSARLSARIMLVTSILFILILLGAGITSHILISSEAQNSATNLLSSTIKDIEAKLQNVQGAVDAETWIVEENRLDKESLYHITRKLVEENDDVIGSAIAFCPNYFPGEYYFSPYSYVDPSTGEVLSKQLGNDSYDYFTMEWFNVPRLNGTPVWTEPYFDEGGGSVLMSTYSHPLKDSDGNVYAVITADISLEWLSDLVSEIKPYPNSTVIMASRNGQYLHQSKENNLFFGETLFTVAEGIDDARVTELASSMVQGKSGTVRFTVGNRIYFAVFGPVFNGWSSAILCQYKEVLSRANRIGLAIFILGILGLAALFFFCYYTVKSQTRPLSDFSASALEIAKGDFHTPLPEIKSEDEIKQLRDSFDYMQHSLTDYIDELRSTTASKERYESELNIANRIQMNMVPKDFPTSNHLGLYALLKPAREVGGDFYDFYVKDDKYAFFAIGDVSGKGVPAALVMAITKASFRFVSGLQLSLDEVVERMNNSVSQGNTSEMFVTLFVGKLDLETGLLKYCNAGHNPIVVIDPEGNASFLPCLPNIAIGVFPGFKYKMQEISLKKGTRLVLYTDGVTEAERADKTQFGEKRLLQWAANPGTYPNAAEACNGLYQVVKDFVEGNEQNDDITIMTIKYK